MIRNSIALIHESISIVAKVIFATCGAAKCGLRARALSV
jgi:hypothetical protein